MREQLLEAVVRRGEEDIKALPPERRSGAVRSIIQRLSEKTDDELISLVSTGKRDIDPELLGKIEELKPMLETQAVRDSIARGKFSGFPKLEGFENEAKLQSLGVDTKRELPAGSIELGFGDDPVKAVSRALTKHFKKPVISFKRGEDILYLDPTDNVLVKANPNIFGAVGKALPIAGDIAGTIGGGAVGAVLTKHPAGMVAGESLGSGALTGGAEYLRLYVGKALGLHDLSHSDMAIKAAEKGGDAAIATLATGGLISAAKGVNNFLKGRIFTKEAALQHGLTTKEADAVIGEVNKILGKNGVKGTLFTRTGDVVTGSSEAQVRKNIKHASDFIERDLSDQKALVKSLDIVTKPGKAEGGKAIQDIAEKQISKRITQAKSIVSDTTQKLDDKISILGKTNKETVGEPTREVLLSQSKKAKKGVEDAWQSVKTKGGFNEKTESFGIKIPLGKETARRSDIMLRRSKDAVTDITKRPIVKKGSPDLADYNREISDLKSDLRAAKKNKQFGTIQTKDLDDVIHSLEADRRTHLVQIGRGDLIDEIEKAEIKTAKFHDAFNRSIVGKLTKKDETGVFTIQSKKFVDTVLKGDTESAKQLLDVIGTKPSLVNMWKEGISNAYKRDVIDKVKPFKVGSKISNEQRKEVVSKTESWISKHSDVLGQFFTKQELGNIKQTGNLAMTVKKQIAQYNQIINGAAKKFGRGKLTSLDPENLVKFVTGKSGSFSSPTGRGVEATISKIRYVKNITKNHPGAWGEFQKEYSTSLRKTVVDPDSGFIKPKAISDWINSQSDEITEVMGPEYAKNIRSINKVTQLLKEKPISLGGDETRAGIIQAIRSGAAPPLTRRGRAFTAAVIFDNKRAHDVIAKALLDPTTMKKVAKLAEHKTLNREAIELAVSLGIITE